MAVGTPTRLLLLLLLLLLVVLVVVVAEGVFVCVFAFCQM